jgi:GNAT superfamily N-acetyltransferase
VDEILVVRLIEPSEWRIYRELRLRSLAQSPDAFGSTLAAEESGTDGAWTERLGDNDPRWSHPVFAVMKDEPVGLAWGRIQPAKPERADAYQMWVDPGYRGLGAGRMLLDSVIAWARAAGANDLVLGVTCGDSPARRLYERAGFRAVDEPEPLRLGSDVMAQCMHLDLDSIK